MESLNLNVPIVTDGRPENFKDHRPRNKDNKILDLCITFVPPFIILYGVYTNMDSGTCHLRYKMKIESEIKIKYSEMRCPLF